MAQQDWVDYYAVLELYDPVSRTGNGPDSSPQEIKEAWRMQLQAWHPDKFPAGTKPRERAENRSKAINAAYDVLKNSQTKEAYDQEWLRRNSWFRDGQGKREETTSTLPPEITVRWDPPNAKGTLFYDIPKGEKRRANLVVEPRIGRGFMVEIVEPESGWLRIASPPSRRSVPPFTATVEVDTSALLAGEVYKDDLVFVLKEPSRVLHKEAVRVGIKPREIIGRVSPTATKIASQRPLPASLLMWANAILSLASFYLTLTFGSSYGEPELRMLPVAVLFALLVYGLVRVKRWYSPLQKIIAVLIFFISFPMFAVYTIFVFVALARGEVRQYFAHPR